MKFIKRNGKVGCGGYYSYLFTKHEADELCIGDQTWSDGENVEIYECIDSEVLNDIYSMVDNKHELSIALEQDGVGY